MKTRNRILALLLAVIMFVGVIGTPVTVTANRIVLTKVVEWSINNPRDDTVTQIGENNHLLRLELGTLSAENINLLNTEDISLMLNYTEGENVGSRRLYAWTDLSGAEAAVTEITFASTSNLAANNSVMIRTVTSENSIVFPKHLLISSAGVPASVLYIALTINNDDDAMLSGGNRGGGTQNEFSRWNNVILGFQTIEPCEGTCGECRTCTMPSYEDTDIVAEWNFGEATAGVISTILPGTRTIQATGGKSWQGATLNRAGSRPHSSGAINLMIYDRPTNAVRIYGWLNNPENYTYMKIDTRDKEDLLLEYKIQRGVPEAPSLLIVQTSLDGVNWRTVRDSLVELAPAANTPAPYVIFHEFVHLHKYIEGHEEAYIRWFYSDTSGNPHPPGTSGGSNLGRANGTSGYINFSDIIIRHGHVDPDPECFCGTCSACIHIFEFPLDTVRQQAWAPNVQEGWEDGQFQSPTGDAVTVDARRGERRSAELKYIVFEFNKAPSPWRFTIQNNTWRRYDIDFFPELMGLDADGKPVEGRERKVLEDGTVRYVINMDTAMPPVNNMGNWTSDKLEHTLPHDGYDRSVINGEFQVLLHAHPEPNIPGIGTLEPDWEQRLNDFFGRNNEGGILSRAYFTNVHPDEHRIVAPEVVNDWADFPPEIMLNSMTLGSSTVGKGALKFHFEYEAAGVDAVRLQYSLDGAVTWNNMQSRISVFENIGTSGRRFVILPKETYNQEGIMLRFVPHGPDWNNWPGTFVFKNPRLVSGLQAGERARAPSPVISISNVLNPPTGMMQRDRSSQLADPEVKFRDDFPIPENFDASHVQWISRDNNVAKVVTGVVRGMNPGTATIRVAATDDTTIFTEFNVSISAGIPNPIVKYTIANPYHEVNWSTWNQYKYAAHTHTTNSDGQASILEAAERHYLLGFDIVAFTNHDQVAPSPDRALSGTSQFGPIVPMTTERVNQMHNGDGRDGRPMIFVPNANERSSLLVPEITRMPTGHHVNVYWSETTRNAGFATGSNALVTNLLIDIANEGRGLARLNHLGRNTGGLFPARWNDAVAISQNAANFLPYVNIAQHPFVFGMEIINKFDTETQADRILWDNMLTELMPRGIPLWGSSDDDSHFQIAIGFSYNLMLMPELTLGEFRHSLTSGAYLPFSRVDREYGIYPGGIQATMWDGNNEEAQSALALSVPRVNNIVVTSNESEDKIFIDASFNGTQIDNGNNRALDNTPRPMPANFVPFIDWYADGIRIHRGNTLDLRDKQLQIYSYVRASIVTPHGVIYTQPFGIQIQGQERPLQILEGIDRHLNPMNSVGEPQPITLPSGSAKTEMGLRLPGGTALFTNAALEQGVRPGTIIWDLENVNYDPNSKARQEFVVNGRVRLPSGIDAIRHIDKCEDSKCIAAGGCLKDCTNPACADEPLCDMDCDFRPCEFFLVSLDVSVTVVVEEYICRACEDAATLSWTPKFTFVDEDGEPQNKEVTGDNIGGDMGIQNAASTALRVEIDHESNGLRMTSLDGTHRPVRIHTHGSTAGRNPVPYTVCNADVCVDHRETGSPGCAPGCDFESKPLTPGFAPVEGQKYRISFMVSVSQPVAGGNGSMRIVNRPGTSGDSVRVQTTVNELTTRPRLVTHEWVQHGTELIAFDTYNTPVGTALIVNDIKIELLTPCDNNEDCVLPCANTTCGNCTPCRQLVNRVLCQLHGTCGAVACELFRMEQIAKIEAEIEDEAERLEALDNITWCVASCDFVPAYQPCLKCINHGFACPTHPGQTLPCGVCNWTHCAKHPKAEHSVLAPCGVCAETHCEVHIRLKTECFICYPVIPAVKIGDTNGDGALSIIDALEILMYLAGMPSELDKPSNYPAGLIIARPPAPADKITISDALEILMYLAGMPTALDVHWPR
jgi:hypothetical protein